MSYDSERIRRAMQRTMAEKGIVRTKWAATAGLSEAPLRHFLNGASDTMTVKSLEQLADAADVPVCRLIGEDPDTVIRDTITVLLDQIRHDGMLDATDNQITEYADLAARACNYLLTQKLPTEAERRAAIKALFSS